MEGQQGTYKIPFGYFWFRMKLESLKVALFWALYGGPFLIGGLVMTNSGFLDDESGKAVVGLLFLLSFVILAILLAYLPIWSRLWLFRYVKTYECEVNDEEIVIREGVFSRTETHIPFSRIQNMEIRQDFWEKKFGWYSLVIYTSASKVWSSKAKRRIVGLKRPEALRREIYSLARKYVAGAPGHRGKRLLVRIRGNDAASIKEITQKLDVVARLLEKIKNSIP
nr:PH domain-containing protein [Candidatus Sigynarchaeum springense]